MNFGAHQSNSVSPANGIALFPLATIFLLLTITLAVYVRANHVGEQDYWLDELHSLSGSAGLRKEFEELPHDEIVQSWPGFTSLQHDSNGSKVWHSMRDDSHPPVYFVLLNAWRRAFGDERSANRMLSVLASVLSLAPLLLCLRRDTKVFDKLFAVLVLALSFSHVTMAQQLRPYSLSILFVNLSFAFFILLGRARGAKSAGRNGLLAALYVSSLVGAMLTHYFAALPLAAHALYAICRFRGKVLATWLMCSVVAAIAWCVIWGPAFLDQWDFIQSQDWLIEQRADHVYRSLCRFLDLPIRLLFVHDRFAISLPRAAAGGLILVALLAAMARKKSNTSFLFACWYLIPAVACLAIDLTTDKQLLSHIRYTSTATAGLVGMVVSAAGIFSFRYRRALLGLVVVAMFATLPMPARTHPQSNTAAKLIQSEFQEGDLLVFDAIDWPKFWASRLYYVTAYNLPDDFGPFLVLREAPSSNTLEKIKTFNRLIVVSPRIDGVPNPDPDWFLFENKTQYIDGIGWVYLFVGPTRAGS